jgi:hypothetical protein
VGRPLDLRAGVHHDVKTRVGGALSRLLVDDAKLQPDGPRPDGDRLVDVLAGLIRAAEDVDDVDRKVDVPSRANPGSPSTASALGLTGTIRKPLACMKADTPYAVRY